MLTIRLTRLNPTHHRFEAIRADGTREVRELETRTFLLHDLVHFAVESESGLTRSFYGSLAGGGAYDDIQDGDEAMETESIVGPLQGALKADVNAADFVARVHAYRASMNLTGPDWLTQELIERVLERLRQLQGQWRATPFGESLELRFEI